MSMLTNANSMKQAAAPRTSGRLVDLSGPQSAHDPIGPTKHEWKQMFHEPRSIEDGPSAPEQKVNVKGRAQAAQKLRVTDTSQKGFMKQVRSDIQKMSPKQFNKAYPVVDEFKKISKVASPEMMKKYSSVAPKITSHVKITRSPAASALRAAKSAVQKTLGIVPKNLAKEVGFKRIEGTLDNAGSLAKQYGNRAVTKAIHQEYLGSNAGKIMRAAKWGSRAAAASKLLGKANPWVGAALGAMELKRNIPQLVKGIPAYMKERQAQKTSEKNLASLRSRAASMVKTQMRPQVSQFSSMSEKKELPKFIKK